MPVSRIAALISRYCLTCRVIDGLPRIAAPFYALNIAELLSSRYFVVIVLGRFVGHFTVSSPAESF